MHNGLKKAIKYGRANALIHFMVLIDPVLVKKIS
jgi:hypothetical protein